MEFTISQKIKDMIKKSKDSALMRCALYGHDYRKVDGIEGNGICICCGRHSNQPLEITGKGQSISEKPE